ncbi:MAG: AAA family ATPase [Bdellovibrionota bacterium]
MRERKLRVVFAKKLRQWPVLCVFGPRQCGKSTFLRELAFEEGSSAYFLFDRQAVREEARRNPELFLKRAGSGGPIPIVLDEIHKSPNLFDEIKSVIDSGAKRPGQFVLTGSVRFSKKIGVRESLTGRAGSLQMDSMSLAETLGKGVTVDLSSLLRYLERGGMPAICFTREADVRQEYWQGWLEKLCEQDLKQFSRGRMESDLAYEAIRQCCLLEDPCAATIAKAIGQDSRRVLNHLDALVDLFVLRRLEAHPKGVGKTRFMPFDCGLAQFFGAPLFRRLQIAFFHHFVNERTYAGIETRGQLTYYRHPKGAAFDFVIGGRHFVRILDKVGPGGREVQKAEGIVGRIPKSRLTFLCATDENLGPLGDKIAALPWRELVPLVLGR